MVRIALLGLGLIGAASAFTSPSAFSLRAPALRTSVCRTGLSAVSMSSEKEQRIADINEVMSELNEFRDRVVNDTTAMAKKVKAKPRDLRKTLESHADILKIDQAIEQLEAELAELGEPVSSS